MEYSYFSGGGIRPGDKFNRFTVVGPAPGTDPTLVVRRWVCRCACGTERELRKGEIKAQSWYSCGCEDRPSSLRSLGGGSSKPAYKVWHGFVARCTNPLNPCYPDYSARGITVSEAWRSFDEFFTDMGNPPAGHQLFRLDQSKGYSKENCAWMTRKQWGEKRRSEQLAMGVVPRPKRKSKPRVKQCGRCAQSEPAVEFTSRWVSICTACEAVIAADARKLKAEQYEKRQRLREQKRAEKQAKKLVYPGPKVDQATRTHHGHLGEALFLAEAVKNGLVVSRPNADVGYDYITDAEGVLKRVQVKYCGSPQTKRQFGIKDAKKYSRIGVEVIALYIGPTSDWYLIPTSQIAGQDVLVNPATRSTQYERFRSAWEVLKERPSGMVG